MFIKTFFYVQAHFPPLSFSFSTLFFINICVQLKHFCVQARSTWVERRRRFAIKKLGGVKEEEYLRWAKMKFVIIFYY